ncbi:MAG: glutathione peroxidase [Bacteroidia bacterium]|nr:glutathione peroxidase [Bacteroidia bacterium]
MSNTIYQFDMVNIDGETVSLSDYQGKVVLIVNVASKCGLTPQYEDLENLYREYKDKGLVVLGFPANNFMGQEPGSNDEIHQFCTSIYGVEFPMFSKISVKGRDKHPLYEFLTTKKLNGVNDGEVKWNFQKFLIGRDGKLIKSIAPTTRVVEPKTLAEIQALLN